MRLVYKDGVQIKDLDDFADGDLIATLKAQGWSEPSYYCKNCGEVTLSIGLCKCFVSRDKYKATLNLRSGDKVEIIAEYEGGSETYVVVVREMGHIHIEKELDKQN